MNESTKPQRQVGRRVDRLESRSKVTGTADYTHNLVLPRMLHAKVVRSSEAHARILSIDTSAAAAMPGVFQVVTAQDVLEIIPIRTMVRHFTTSPSWRFRKSGTSASPSRSFSRRTCTSQKRRQALSS